MTDLPAHIADLPTPALLVERDVFDANLAAMAAVLPGDRLRPHIKAHKCTELARRQRDVGHHHFTVATIREAEGMHAAGLGQDLLLANEILDARRIGALVEAGARVAVAVDSAQTVAAAAAGGVREVVIDVNVGLPRCGCHPEAAGGLARAARDAGLQVRGVMGYEGHLMMVEDPADRAAQLADSMKGLALAAEEVGGEIVSSGGTGTFAEHAVLGVANEVQAGSYALMDTYYGKLGLPFGQALTILGTVISAGGYEWAVADVGLKSHGMDHGDPSIPGHAVWFLSDEHTIFANTVEQGSPSPVVVGDRVRVHPAHVDPTVAMHADMWLVDGDRVLERWPVDLRGW